MKIVLTQKFRHSCLLCNCTPMSEGPTKQPLPMFHAEGVDVNWGEDALICQICVGVMADMLGRPSIDMHAQLIDERDDLQLQLEEVTGKFSDQSERINKILEGRKAEREQKAA